MSIRLMTLIWDSGAWSGGTLLVALALADFANDDGSKIFPHVETLATKARLSVRATQNALEALKSDEVLIPLANTSGGRGKSVEYRIDVERVKNLRLDEKGAVIREKGCSPDQERVQEKTERVQSATPHIEEPPEPSSNHQGEPPAASPPHVPGDAVLFQTDLLDNPSKPLSPSQQLDAAYAAYDEAAQRNEWGQVRKRTGARDAALRRRLKDADGLQGWLDALAKAEASDFLCARAPPSPGRTPFKADFDFLTRESSFVKLMEGKYDNREGTGGPAGGGSFLEAAGRVAARHASDGAY